jgi:hypothetical protein
MMTFRNIPTPLCGYRYASSIWSGPLLRQREDRIRHRNPALSLPHLKAAHENHARVALYCFLDP